MTKTDEGYLARVTPPHGQGTNWSNTEPMALTDLIAKLRSLDCHTTDIGDALYEADPYWAARLSE